MMTAKTFFAQVSVAEDRLRTLRARLAHYEDLGATITSNTSAVGGHHAGASRVEMAAVGMVDAMRAIQTQIDGYMALVRQAEMIIDQIPQEKYKTILTLRYLCGWSFQSISDELRYTDPKSVYRAHGWALTEAQKIMRIKGFKS